MQLLKDVGLDFTFLLSSLLQPTASSGTPSSSGPSSRTRPTLTIPTSSPAPAGFDINPSPFVNYSMGLNTPAPQGPHDRRGPTDYTPGPGPDSGYGPDDDPKASPYDLGAYEDTPPPDSGRRTAPLAIKKASREAERSGSASPGLPPASGPGGYLRGEGGRHGAEMGRTESSRSGEGHDLR